MRTTSAECWQVNSRNCQITAFDHWTQQRNTEKRCSRWYFSTSEITILLICWGLKSLYALQQSGSNVKVSHNNRPHCRSELFEHSGLRNRPASVFRQQLLTAAGYGRVHPHLYNGRQTLRLIYIKGLRKGCLTALSCCPTALSNGELKPPDCFEKVILPQRTREVHVCRGLVTHR